MCVCFFKLLWPGMNTGVKEVVKTKYLLSCVIVILWCKMLIITRAAEAKIRGLFWFALECYEFSTNAMSIFACCIA